MPQTPDSPLPGAAPRDLPSVSVDRPLTVPLLIRGSYDHGLFVTFCAAAIILTGIGLVMLFRDRPPTRSPNSGYIFLLLGVAATAPAILVGLWLRGQRQWLEVTVTGFVLTHQDQRRVYSDEQVIGITQRTHTLTEGTFKRRVVLEIAANEGVERIDCRYSVTSPNPDPLTGFFERLVNRIVRRLDEPLVAGVRLCGEGWQYDRTGLRHKRGFYPIEEIGWVGFFDGHLCVWRGGEERPFLRLPETGRNVTPLGRNLWQRISRRPGFDRPLEGCPLGRVLLERWAWGFYIGLALMGLAAVSLAIILVVTSVDWRNRGGLAGVGVACCIGWIIGAIVAFRGREGHIRFHEHGVAQRGFRRTRWVLYEELAEVTWKRDQTLVFRTHPGPNRVSIRFRPLMNALDAEVSGMRDHACSPLARRWAEVVPLGPLAWTTRLRFTPGGLEYRPMGLLGLCEPVSVPYEYTSYRIEGEYFLLMVSDQKRPACKIRLNSPNFFVGLVLLNQIYATFEPIADMDGVEDHAPTTAPLTESSAPDARISRELSRGSAQVTALPPAPASEDD